MDKLNTSQKKEIKKCAGLVYDWIYASGAEKIFSIAALRKIKPDPDNPKYSDMVDEITFELILAALIEQANKDWIKKRI